MRETSSNVVPSVRWKSFVMAVALFCAWSAVSDAWAQDGELADRVTADGSFTPREASLVTHQGEPAVRSMPASAPGRSTPANDDCVDAYSFDLFPDVPVTFSDDNTGATMDCPEIGFEPTREVWYKFTTHEQVDLEINFEGTDPYFQGVNVQLTTTCPCSAPFITASEMGGGGEANPTLWWDNLPAGTYYYAVMTDSSEPWTYSEGPYTITFIASSVPSCPEDSLFGQPTDTSDPGAVLPSGATYGYKLYDNFNSVDGKIGSLQWWGVVIRYTDEGGFLAYCDPPDITFEIGLYQDDNGKPGLPVATYVVTPTVAPTGELFLYRFNVDELLPCVVLSDGWISIQSQPNPDGCTFSWVLSPSGDGVSYYEYAGGYAFRSVDCAFCLMPGDCPLVYGACCNDYDGSCQDGVEQTDCLLPERFTPNTSCGELTPTCGVEGACCDANQDCVLTGLEVDCEEIGGQFYPGESCEDFSCQAECKHRIELDCCPGLRWEGNSLDVLVNGITVLDHITVPDPGERFPIFPLSFEFSAATGDTITTVFYADGDSPEGTLYRLYDSLGYLIGEDGIAGAQCYIAPSGITAVGNCDEPTTGACCYDDGGCEMLLPEECTNGVFLGIGHMCFECPCVVSCPPEAIPEPEPCGEDTDGGCDAGTPAFVPVSFGDTVCGTLWVDHRLNPDYDWYELILDEWSHIYWTIECEIPVQVDLMRPDADGSCENHTLIWTEMAGECQEVTLSSEALSPGHYWIRVRPLLSTPVRCEQRYVATVTHESAEPMYCEASGDGSGYISRVQIGSIDNETDLTGYGDYSSMATDVPLEGDTFLTVLNGFALGDDYCSVWVDWDRDMAFAPGELIDLIEGYPPYDFVIRPPAGTSTGPVRMRVRIARGHEPQPCDEDDWDTGEVEDYTLNVVEVPGACCMPGIGCQMLLPSECSGVYGGSYTACGFEDCNSNGIDDFCDIADGSSSDCDEDGIPDECLFDDCNGNEIPDSCDLADCDGSPWCSDCNHNSIPDECDIAECSPGDLSCADCQNDGIPDGCQLGMGEPNWVYAHDDGVPESEFGSSPSCHLAWLNAFVVEEDASTIVKIEVAYGRAAVGTPLMLYIWEDPTQDGDPADAVVLASFSTEVANPQFRIFNAVDIPPVYVGDAGTHFFVGCIMDAPQMTHPALLDGSSPQGKSWVLADLRTQIDPNDLGGFDGDVPLQLIDDWCCSGNWAIRAQAVRGVDFNGNGIPDECDSCGDLDGDGDVDYDDYVILLAAFGGPVDGTPPQDGLCDYDNSGAVGLADYDVWLGCYRDFIGDPLAGPPSKPAETNPHFGAQEDPRDSLHASERPMVKPHVSTSVAEKVRR